MLRADRRLIHRWRRRGRPAIPLPSGGEAVSLPRFLGFCRRNGLTQDIEAVRRYLGASRPPRLLVSGE